MSTAHTAHEPPQNPDNFGAAYSANGLAVSREAFYALACDPERSVVVEACAGAGKTWMLVSRILRALLEGAEPHEILAITFTKKAAGEMRLRLSEWLQAWAAPGCSHEARVEELRARGLPADKAEAMAPALSGLHEHLLQGLRSVEVRTFHAWFAQLMRHAPLSLLAELGLQPGMGFIEELDEHLDDVFRRFYQALLKEPVARQDYEALVAAHGVSHVRKWLQAGLAKRVEIELADGTGALEDSVPSAASMWPELEGLAHPTEVLLGERWRCTLSDAAELLAQKKDAAKRQDAAQGIRRALLRPHAPDQFAALWGVLFTNNAPRKQLGDLPDVAHVSAELERLRQQVTQHTAHTEHLRMVRLMRVLLVELAHYKRSQGLADMGDLERCALHLLRDSTLAGWVQERLDVRIRHVLMDEFQDTNPLQWHALKSWLEAYAGAGGGASGHKPPSVFIVGDPKQSIYRFRGGDPRVFAEAARLVTGTLSGHHLACDHTRRNVPEVIGAVNTVFSAAQAQGAYPGFRTHTTEVRAKSQNQAEPAALRTLPQVMRPPAEPKRKAGEPAPRHWRDTLTEPRHEPEEVLRQQEARWVAQAVRELVDSGRVAPSDIFVLSRKRESLRWAALALQELHVPHVAGERRVLMDCAEVADLVAVLDVLASPTHRLSLARCLRSPLIGATDDDLVALHELALAADEPSGNSADWWRALVQHEHADRPALQRARTLLLAWRRQAQCLPPHDLLDCIVAQGQFREGVAAALPAERRAGVLNAIDALLYQALTLDGARYATPYSFVRALKRRAIKVTAPAQPEAVQLLTVHGAKGLESRVVFVMDAWPENSNSDTAVVLVDWPAEEETPSRCAFVYSESTCPPSLKAALEDENIQRQREELNGLYAAMTRARDMLVFSSTEPHRKPQDSSWWQRVAPLAQAWEPVVLPSASADAGAFSQHAAHAEQFTLQTLPEWRDAAALPLTPLKSEPAAPVSSPATLLGMAVHRVLEWATAPVVGRVPDLTALAQAAAKEFEATAAEVERIARQIFHSPQCAAFFTGPGIVWAGNEVTVVESSELLRLDRLVALQDPHAAGGAGRVWWVLDYKVATQPEALASYTPQMQRYRRAVSLLQPGEPVRCALIDGQGRLIEIPEGSEANSAGHAASVE